MVLALLLVIGCGRPAVTQAPTMGTDQLPPPPTDDAGQLLPPPTPAITRGTTVVPPAPTATATPLPPAIASQLFGVVLQPGLPAIISEAARNLVQSAPLLFSLDPDLTQKGRQLSIGFNGDHPLASWVFAVAAPFATIPDETTMVEISAGWQTGQSGLGALILDEQSAAAFSALWGPPGPGVTVVPTIELRQDLWASRPAWTLQPFERLSPELKVIRVDGQSPVDKEFEPLLYPLVVPVGVSGIAGGVRELLSRWPGPESNRDPGRLTTVAMSGVTALGRATAYQMEIQGITTPGQVVGPILQAADIAHVSHEVPFVSECPYPSPIGDPIFCARDEYLELLQSIGTDVVEVTGNHVNDWGADNFLHTLDLYDEAGIKTFGGGRQLVEAREPALFEHNGNKIAFVGCNPVGPPHAWATETAAGALPCDYPALFQAISELKAAGYLVIATLQYSEFYQYAPTAQQQQDFRALVDAGAAAVSGSQGHHAQGFDLYNEAFIHYGLGNLFFDQMEMLGTRQSFIDTYTIYDGRLLSVTLTTTLIENYCCPREMNQSEREAALLALFQASGW